jgi:alkylation response protein AidB-like acyl-CoA dehydrogenase
MANFFKDNEDLQFYVERGIDWAPLVELTEMGFTAKDGFKSTDEAVQFYKDVMEMVGEFAAEEIAPHSATIDKKGMELVDGEVVAPAEFNAIFKKIKDIELHPLPLPRELGGMNAPMLVYMLNSEVIGRADVSIMAHHGFHAGIAMSMLLYSLKEGTTRIEPETGTILETRWQSAIEEIARGEAWGCMDITESDAGSDMGAIRSKGEQDEHGNWFVTGQKIFITSGHGKYHFVIARTEKGGDGPMGGLEGLSLFLVKTYDDTPEGRVWHATVSRIEEKIGHHGSVTATIDFDRSPAELVGKRGEGFKLMLLLMNNARIGVGFESLGLCEAAYRLAKEYAAERRSMGKTIDRHEMIADYLDEMRTDIQGIRAMAVEGAYWEELAHKKELFAQARTAEGSLERKRLEKEARRAKRRARRVTPLLKYLAAEKAVEMTRKAIQIHGGVGYTQEYGAEKLLRDALVMPIYEGTSQIQSLMAMKDTLGAILRNPQGFVRDLAQARWRSMSARDPLERRLAKLQTYSYGAQQHLVSRTAMSKLRSLTGQPFGEWAHAFKGWDPKRDFAHAMLHAERLTRILADVAVAEILHEQAKRHEERRDVLERWLDRAEPRARFLHDEITTTGDRLITMLRGQADAPLRKAE